MGGTVDYRRTIWPEELENKGPGGISVEKAGKAAGQPGQLVSMRTMRIWGRQTLELTRSQDRSQILEATQIGGETKARMRGPHGVSPASLWSRRRLGEEFLISAILSEPHGFQSARITYLKAS